MNKLEKLTPFEVVTEPDWKEKFGTARQYQHMVKMSFAQGAAFMILCGAELHRLKKELGETRGKHGKSNNVVTFSELANKYAGVTSMTAWRYEQMFQAAKKRVPLLNAEELLNTPLGLLPELKQQKLLEAVNKVTDGYTAQQLMWDWGIAKRCGTGREQGCKAGGNSTARNPINIDTEAFNQFALNVNLFCDPADRTMPVIETPELSSLVNSLKILTRRLEEMIGNRKNQ